MRIGEIRTKTVSRSARPHRTRASKLRFKFAAIAGVIAALGICSVLSGQSSSGVSDITGDYEFLHPYNTLALLQEDTILKGYIDVLQGQSESDAILSYPIDNGDRKGDQVEFTTRKIHEMYYHFSGIVRRGNGKKPGDPDYLELAGELQTVQNNSVTNQQTVDRRQVVFKSKGKNETEP
ncbi:MAG TPA: hypothetical protein VFC10_17500 [Terriglobia bacterium]|jgi:hypothetical protein|nr:hypothetical protein [Terriglobia bacterium]